MVVHSRPTTSPKTTTLLTSSTEATVIAGIKRAFYLPELMFLSKPFGLWFNSIEFVVPG